MREIQIIASFFFLEIRRVYFWTCFIKTRPTALLAQALMEIILPDFCTGAEPIHPVHASSQLGRAAVAPRNEVIFLPFWRVFLYVFVGDYGFVIIIIIIFCVNSPVFCLFVCFGSSSSVGGLRWMCCGGGVACYVECTNVIKKW